MAAPAGRFSVAFDSTVLQWDAAWTRIDSTPSMLASWTVDRGRAYELDRTDAARATVQINDPDGILDPTNAAGPYYGLIEPLLQAVICRWNPADAEWQPRFRGWITDWTYSFDPSQQVNRLELALTDIFEILGAVEMLPYPSFGDDPIAAGYPESAGQVFYAGAGMDERILQVLQDAGVPPEFKVVFTGNVSVYRSVYSVGETALTAVQEAADAEFPGVSNVYTDRQGRLVVHGRLAKFDPATIAAGAGDTVWDWHHWHAGDGAAVNAAPGTTAHLRRFAYNRGVSKIINSAVAYPWAAADDAIAGQVVQDAMSQGRFGVRSWSAPNLLTREGLLDSSDALTETRRFATYYVDNYAEPHNRVTDIQFRPTQLTAPGAAATFRLMSKIDIADQIDLTVASPGGGGFTAEPFFVEGIHETSRPLNPTMDDDTVTLDLSPKALYDTNPFPT